MNQYHAGTGHACLPTHYQTNSVPYANFLERCICSSPSLSAFAFPASWAADVHTSASAAISDPRWIFFDYDKRQWVTISECLQMLFKEVLQYHPTNNQPIDRICRWKSLALLCIPAPHFAWESGFAFKCIGEKSVVQLKNVIRRLTLMGTMEGRGYIGCLLQQNLTYVWMKTFSVVWS